MLGKKEKTGKPKNKKTDKIHINRKTSKFILIFLNFHKINKLKIL